MVVQLLPYPLADCLTANSVGHGHHEEEFPRPCDAHLRQQNVQMRVQTTLQDFADPVRLFRAYFLRKPATLGANLCYHKCDGTICASFLAKRRRNQGEQRKYRQSNGKHGALSRRVSCPDLSTLSSDQLFADVQPQAKTFAAFQGRIRCLKEA